MLVSIQSLKNSRTSRYLQINSLKVLLQLQLLKIIDNEIRLLKHLQEKCHETLNMPTLPETQDRDNLLKNNDSLSAKNEADTQKINTVGYQFREVLFDYKEGFKPFIKKCLSLSWILLLRIPCTTIG